MDSVTSENQFRRINHIERISALVGTTVVDVVEVAVLNAIAQSIKFQARPVGVFERAVANNVVCRFELIGDE
ncbi:unnamed protein product [marine sediment metagenome]|uniref:Uncharacterized protein n=1 Tax=marine sediment metagenome TaxID=412755 RepID=X1R015_9ZZZZ